MNQVNTFTASIYIAGDVDQAKQVCRRFCLRGACVTVERVTFIYTGGEEQGVRVGFINYPRFPAEREMIRSQAFNLAEDLRTELCQHSYSIVDSEITTWVSTRQTTRQ